MGVEDGKTQMKKFDEFTKGFDKANHSLSDSLAKSIKVHQAPMKNEMDQLGNSLGQLAVVFKTKVQKRNSGELAEATENAAKKGTPESRELKKKGETINAVLLSEADYLDQI